MKFKPLALGLITSALAACSTTTANPVASDFKESLSFSGIEVAFDDSRSVPEVYDKAVRELIDEGEDSILNTEDFATYLDSRGGPGEGDDRLAERYLEYRIAEEVASTLAESLSGDVPVNVLIDIERVITPNAATMLLVGEIKAIHYDLDVVEADGGTVLLDFSEVSKPAVDRSSGAGGGLLGLAIRAGVDTNIQDLEQMAGAVSEEVAQILAGEAVNKTVAKKIRRP